MTESEWDAFRQSCHIVFTLDDEEMRTRAQEDLRPLASAYGQDAIAWTYGTTTFLS
jgi:hypothetical protein